MKGRNFWLLFSLLLIASFLLAACGGTEKATEVDIETEATTEDATADSSGEETVSDENAITLTIWTDTIMADVIRDASSGFESDFGVNLVVEEFGFGAILTNFVVAAPAGEGPDIIVGAHDWLGELVGNGLLAPIDLGDKAIDFDPKALQAFTYDGELFGMPYMTENVGLFRNIDLVPNAPATWDDVIEISREMTAGNGDDIETNQYGFVLAGNDAYHFFPMMTSYGGYVFGQNADGTYDPIDLGIGSAGTIKAVEVLDSMIEENLVPPSIDGQIINDWFTQGKAALIISGPWNLYRIQESGINYAIDPIPTGSVEGVPFLGSGGFMINAFSENSLLAQIVLSEFIGTSELMQAIYNAEPRTPAYLPVLNNLEDPDIEAFALAGVNALPMPSIPEMGSVWQAWINALILVTQQTLEPEKAFTVAANQIATSIDAKQNAENTSEEVSTDYDMVNIPGTHQTALGCSLDWMPDCEATALTLGDDGLWVGTFEMSIGEYEMKIACNGGWDINFGIDGLHNGSNFAFSVESDTSVTFVFDPETSLLEISGEGVEVGEGTTF